MLLVVHAGLLGRLLCRLLPEVECYRKKCVKKTDRLIIWGISGKMNRRERRAERKLGKVHPQDTIFATALQHHQAGRLPEAQQLYRQVLMTNPRHADTLHLLGVMAHQIGRHEVAADLIGQAIAINPSAALYHSNMGNALKELGRLADAVASYHQAIELAPDYAEAFNNLGTALQALQRLDEAAAALHRAIELKPDFAQAHNNLGNLLVDLGRPQAAVARYRRAIAFQPGYADAHNNLAATLKELGEMAAAILSYRRAIDLQPANAAIHNNLGNLLRDQGALEESISAYRQAIALQPDFAAAHNNLGNALRDQGMLEEAIRAYRRVIELQPDFADAHSHLGTALLEQGEIDAAFAAFDAAIGLAPKRGAFHRMLVNTGRVAADSPAMARLEALAAEALPETDRMQVHFALGAVYAETGDAEKSFAHLLQGNRLKRCRTSYDEAATLALFDRVMGVFTRGFLQARHGAGTISDVPIFVVGMPRSGTTLVEQILASHPRVHGAGELRDLPRLVSQLETEAPETPFPELATTLSGEALARLGAAYLQGVKAHAAASTHIVDKLPDNFLRIGLIRLILPGAKIIHVLRDPVETCLSCFSKLFTDDQPYTYDLGELGRYYRAYRVMMAHWRNILPPDTLLEIRYEDIVADLEGQARRLLSQCGLSWDDRCLAFHDHRRVVRTASAAQVRRPLYASSVGRWHAFAERARPLLDALATS
jgi:tetratricopeptide (TPR) repeat protein